MQWTMWKQFESLKWASMSRGNPRGLGQCLECPGHFSYSCLCHPCVPTKPQGNVSFGKSKCSGLWKCHGAELSQEIHGVMPDPAALQTSQGICHYVSTPAPTLWPSWLLLPPTSLIGKNCGKAQETSQGGSCYFRSISMSGKMSTGSRHSLWHSQSLSPMKTVTLELSQPARILTVWNLLKVNILH